MGKTKNLNITSEYDKHKKFAKIFWIATAGIVVLSMLFSLVYMAFVY